MGNIISPMAYVHPDAKMGKGNVIGPFCYIDEDTVIGDNNRLYNSVTLHKGLRMGNNNEIFPGASLSTKPQDLKFKGEKTTCQIGDNNSIRENVTISRGTASKATTIVGNNNLLMEGVHIAHDCVFGSNLILGNHAKFAGEVECDDNAIVSGVVLCHQFCRIGGYVMIQGGTRFSLDIPPFCTAGKEPVVFAGLNIIGLRRHGFTAERIEAIRDAYRIIYEEGVIKETVKMAREKYPDNKDVDYICTFIEQSPRGIIRPR